MFRPTRSLLYLLNRVKECRAVHVNSQNLSEVLEYECKDNILCNCNISLIFVCKYVIELQLSSQMNIKEDLQKVGHFIWMLKQLHHW